MLRELSRAALLLILGASSFRVTARQTAASEAALSLMLEGSFTKAGKSATDLINADRNNALAYAIRASTEVFESKMTEAQADLEKANKLQPDNGVFVALLGDYHRIQGNMTSAKPLAEKAIALLRSPKTSLDYFARGLASSILDKTTEATADYGKAIELNPRNARALAKRGLIYLNLKQQDAALADLTKAITVNPQYGVAYFYRGYIYLNQQKYDLAITEFTTCVEADPLYADAFFNRGVCYKQKGQYDRALADYSKSLQLNPKDWEAYNNRGNVYYLQKQYDQALAEYDKSIAINAKAPATYVLKGNTYNAKDLPQLAIAEYTKAMEANPSYTDAYVQRGFVYYRTRLLDESMKDFSKVIQLDPRSATGHLYLGFNHHDRQHFNEAITNYSKAIELDPKNMYAYQNRAEAYDAIGQSKQADLDRKKYADLGGTISASGGSTIRSIYPLGTFDPALAKAALQRGLSTIRGKACTKVDGLIFNAQGVKVVLFPVTPYLEEWYDLREKKEGKKTNVYMSNEANQYRIEATADGDGRFEFRGLKPGKYFIQIIHSFNQLKTARVYTGSDVSQNGPVRTTTNFYYDQDYTVGRAKRLEKFVEIKEDGDTQKITLANGLIKSCAF